MSSTRQRRPSLPTIPDMRFETAYLSKLRPYVHVTRTTAQSREPSDDYGIIYDEREKETQEVITIDWANVVWATFRDQVLGMWAQGAVWTLVSFYLTPVYGRLSDSVGRKFRHGEGDAVAYLRGWVHQLGLSGAR